MDGKSISAKNVTCFVRGLNADDKLKFHPSLWRPIAALSSTGIEIM